MKRYLHEKVISGSDSYASVELGTGCWDGIFRTEDAAKRSVDRMKEKFPKGTWVAVKAVRSEESVDGTLLPERYWNQPEGESLLKDFA